MPESAGRQDSLVARDVRKSFGPLQALKGVSVEFAGRARYGLVGPNGSGKSTLLRTLAGVLRVSGGEILIAGEPVTRWDAGRRARAGISMKFQVPRVFLERTIAENLDLASHGRFGRSGPNDSVAAIVDAIHEFGAADDTRAGALGHGQRQWLEIAMAVSTEPRFLLLDEPTAGMSASERARTAQIIEDLACAVVVVEHDLPFVARLCGELTVLHLGEVFMHGDPDEILASARLRELYSTRA
jgi:branched-chain amino acid transport system ATP-binding protein